MFVM